jgi:hypothetical protein
MALRTVWRSSAINSLRPICAYALSQSTSCLGLRQRICFKRREPCTKRARGKHKQEVNPLTFHIILRYAPKNRVRPGIQQ